MSNKWIHWIAMVGGVIAIVEAGMSEAGQAAGPVGIVIALLSVWGAAKAEA